ncbi:DUF3515 family protein [Cryptosporangium phraense]|uniref:DUF3515 family protein n=1 Tax=Cryptosporangium phraense TaxID=2593070 RepID=A0A545ASF6_9ACTN|nr:DUF3515 family protein [Cryptosporangium phraense]TQS44260.1 DUF3515 family protein [Cryptosporangium phraense]
MATATSERSRAAVTATLIALPLALLAGLGWFWLSGGFADDDEPAATGPVTVDLSSDTTVTEQTETVCRALLANLPTTLGEHASRPVNPKSAVERAAVWGDPAIVLRCGVGKPATTAGSAGQVLTINGVSWLVTEGNKVTWLRALNLSVAIDVRLPAPYNVGQPQSLVGPLSAPITDSVPAAK